MNSPQLWPAIAAAIAAYAALLGGLYAIITRPLMARMDSMQAQITEIIRRLERIEAKLDDHSPHHAPGRAHLAATSVIGSGALQISHL